MNPTLKQRLKPGLIYVVLAPTKCQTLEKRDRIRLESNGDLSWLSASGGRLPFGQWERFRCPVVLDRKHYEGRIAKCEQEIREARRILDEEGAGKEIP